MDDGTLLAGGDHGAVLTVLVREHGNAVHSFCRRVMRDPQLAEDMAQKTFTEAFRDLGRFERRSSLRTWLLGIAAHRCQDELKAIRRRSQRIETDDEAVIEYADPTSAPSERLDLARSVAALEECLDGLSDHVRSTVLLRFFAGMSYEEMSIALATKADTLHARVSRALPALRRCLGRKGFDGE